MNALKQQAKRLVASARVGEQMPTFCLAQDSIDRLKEPTDLSKLIEEVKDDDTPNRLLVHESVVWVEASLRNPIGISSTGRTDDDASSLLKWLCESLKPTEAFGWKSPFAPDPQDEVDENETYHFRLMVVAGLRAVSSLFRLIPGAFEEPILELIVCLSTFTDTEDPWTRAESHDLAVGLLARCEALYVTRLRSLIPNILQKVVRPAFSKQKQSAITASGRQALNPSLVNAAPSYAPEAEEKPWKFLAPRVTTVFLWCVTKIDPLQLNNLWPQITPPTLAMMDDGAVPFKAKGCRALRSILTYANGSEMQRTGLGDVFEQALLPMLAQLPSLTEEADSLVLLNEAYPTLRLLVNTRHKTPAERNAKLKAMDTIMRTGVIRGYQYAGEYPKIGTFLAKEMARLVEEMKIDAVKHLKNIIPIMVDNLCNPFATAAPSLLLASAKTLQTIILICWPRISDYAGHVLKGIVVCWCRIGQEIQSDALGRVKLALKDVLKLLRATLATENVAMKDIDTVLKSDERLEELMTV